MRTSIRQGLCGATLLLTAVAMLLAPTATRAQAQNKADLQVQLKLLLEWWPGVYDNNEQIVRQSGGGLSTPTDQPFHRLRTAFTRVTLPALGANLLYVEEFRDNEPTRTSRIRLYALSIDDAERGIRVRMYSPVAQAALAGTWRDAARVEKTTAADWQAAASQCDLLLHYVGAQFAGSTLPRSCAAGNRAWTDFQTIVSARQHWLRHRLVDARTGQSTWELNPGAHFGWVEQTKARHFRCTVNHNAAGDMTRTEKLTTIELDDQGGEADIAWPDGRTLTFIIHRRAFASPSDREFVLYRIHEKGNRVVPLAYAYAEDTALRFGLNLGWFYILCAPADVRTPGS